jgi:deoxycytidine triphosphate deaminase
MILGVKKLLELVKKKKLVENLSERELKNPEGAGFDIRIGELYEVKGKGFLGVEERETPEIKLIAKVDELRSSPPFADARVFDKKKIKKVFLRPRTYYLMKTIEKLNLPENLLALFTPRSTLYRSGVYIFGGQTAPGYKGELTTGIFNFRDEKFKLEMGARVMHIMFFEVKGKSNLYRGQWQGGRITTKKKEKQI